MVPHFHVRQYTWVLPLLSALIKVSPASATNICGHLSFDTTERKPGLKPRRDSVLSDVQRQHFHAINQDNHPRVIVYD